MDFKKFGLRVEDVIILFIIALNILDFFELLPDYLDYVDKIVSFTVLSYLLYKISLSDLFFGTRKKEIDILLIMSYLLLTTKTITYWAVAVADNTHTAGVKDIILYLANHASQIDLITFMIGSGMLVLIGIYATKFHITIPSIMSIFHETARTNTFKQSIFRFAKILFLLLAFFLVVFNLLFEWLAIAIDDPIGIIIILVYIFYIIKNKHKLHAESVLFKISDAGEKLYDALLTRLKYKTTLYLGVCGMLVLHLLTDFAFFLIPYILVIKEPYYYHGLANAHDTMYQLILRDVLGQSFFTASTITFLYILNFVGAFLLLVTPAVLWYFMYAEKILKIRTWYLALFFCGITALLLAPTLHLTTIDSSNIAGIDIQMTSLLYQPATFPVALSSTLIISLGIGILVFLLSMQQTLRKGITLLAVSATLLFFCYYLYLYASTILMSYVYSIIFGQTLFVTIMLVLFLFVHAAFFIGGTFLFLTESFKKLRKYLLF